MSLMITAASVPLKVTLNSVKNKLYKYVFFIQKMYLLLLSASSTCQIPFFLADVIWFLVRGWICSFPMDPLYVGTPSLAHSQDGLGTVCIAVHMTASFLMDVRGKTRFRSSQGGKKAGKKKQTKSLHEKKITEPLSSRCVWIIFGE